MSVKLSNKRIFISGVCGTVGSELVKQLLTNDMYSPLEVIGVDNDETNLFFIDQEYLSDPRVNFFLVDIRDRDELLRKMRDIDYVFHSAALKHVIINERSPEQAIQTNIVGVQNIIYSAIENKVEKVIFTSSDKAVNPTNVMGTSKLMGERLMTAANSNKRSGGPIFASTRFGNVLGSSGSVIPIFHNQIKNGGPVTVTDNQMTRFVMSVQESVRLVIDTIEYAKGGEVFITKMPVIQIEALAQAMIEELAPRYGFKPEEIEITEIGIKPGEKLYEELMNSEENRRAIELKQYFSVLPAFRGVYHDIEYDYDDIVTKEVTNPYISANESPLTVGEIKNLLSDYGLLAKPLEKASERYWPGDKEESN